MSGWRRAKRDFEVEEEVVAKRTLPWLVIAVLLGLLGMHALSLPGLSTQDDHAGHSHASQGMLLLAAPVETTIDAPASDAGSGLGSLVIICCGAMLVATLGIAWLVARSQRPTLSAPTPLRLHRHEGTKHTSRHGQGPPYVWDFSIARC